jgi:L-ascorbate metabolism protein UlaG (beta-lactamase superfamily)
LNRSPIETRPRTDPTRRRGAEVGLVLATHAHTDHLDGKTLRAICAASPSAVLAVPAACRETAIERVPLAAGRLLTLDAGDRVELAGFEFTAIPAAHETPATDGQGHCLYLGYIVCCGGTSIYHAGDTVRFAGMAEMLREHRIDVALLPINGRPGVVPGNLTAAEAVELTRDIGAGMLIPCHFDMFDFNTADRAECEEMARQAGVQCVVLCPGECWP